MKDLNDYFSADVVAGVEQFETDVRESLDGFVEWLRTAREEGELITPYIIALSLAASTTSAEDLAKVNAVAGEAIYRLAFPRQKMPAL